MTRPSFTEALGALPPEELEIMQDAYEALAEQAPNELRGPKGPVLAYTAGWITSRCYDAQRDTLANGGTLLISGAVQDGTPEAAFMAASLADYAGQASALPGHFLTLTLPPFQFGWIASRAFREHRRVLVCALRGCPIHDHDRN